MVADEEEIVVEGLRVPVVSRVMMSIFKTPAHLVAPVERDDEHRPRRAALRRS